MPDGLRRFCPKDVAESSFPTVGKIFLNLTENDARLDISGQFGHLGVLPKPPGPRQNYNVKNDSFSRMLLEKGKWFADRAWSWLTLKPGPRPYRAARRVVRTLRSVSPFGPRGYLNRARADALGDNDFYLRRDARRTYNDLKATIAERSR